MGFGFEREFGQGPLLGAIAAVPLLGSIAGCHCAIAGCHAGVPFLGAIAGCHCEKNLTRVLLLSPLRLSLH